MSKIDLRLGDCLEVLKTIPENSVDSIVTDPPAGIAFMGKNWDDPFHVGKSGNGVGQTAKDADYDKYGKGALPYGYSSSSAKRNISARNIFIAWMQEIAAECLRVIKPGGHALVWAIPRTSHWTATAWENAGFEVKDNIVHAFGSGFPKSLNIGKNVDRLLGNNRKSMGIVDSKTGADKGKNWKCSSPRFYEETKGTSEWEGWGTALKPAIENWLLLRKPLSEKTIAENVLRWKCGGINVDGCRIESAGDVAGTSKSHSTPQDGWDRPWRHDTESAQRVYEAKQQGNRKAVEIGRFPANLILSYPEDEYDESGNLLPNPGKDEILGLFPMTGGGKYKFSGKRENREYSSNAMNSFNQKQKNAPDNYGDTGSAARFFYCAKASKAERNEGLSGMPAKNTSHDGRDKFIENPYQRHENIQQNFHPTVKPIKLMRYLCRLITFPGGTVLDPFMGSGTTGKAAKQEGFNFIGIEKELEYFEIAKKRIGSHSPQMELNL